MKNKISRLFSVNWLKSFYLNIYYFPGTAALHFPILVGYHVKIENLGSRRSVVLPEESKPIFATLCFCLKGGPYIMGNKISMWNIEEGGKIILKGTARFSKGTFLSVQKNATLTIGNLFSSNANLYLQCSNNITLGDDVLLGWNNVIMDSDGGHPIYDSASCEVTNPSQPIIIGNHVWLGEGSSVLKGAFISDGCILASKAIASRVYDKPNAIIAGIPGKIIKENIRWEHR